jgi:membrane protein YqaA with SNARE-associated domain
MTLFSMYSIFLVSRSWNWLLHLGGPGLIALGLLDNSVIPIPGGMDLGVILLSAYTRTWWPYYAFMATVGALIGGYLTYRLAEKGGEATLEKKFGKKRASKVYGKFKKRGFTAIAVSAVLPPPFPIVPVLMAAGVVKYPTKKFLAALSVGRSVRFLVVAALGHYYGAGIVSRARIYYMPVLYTLIALAIAGTVAGLWYWKRMRR